MKLRVSLLVILLSPLLVTAAPLLAQDRSYGRSMVINDGGIVATSHTLASQAGAQRPPASLARPGKPQRAS